MSTEQSIQAAVTDALAPVSAQLETIEGLLRGIGQRLQDIADDPGQVREQDIAEVRDAVNYLTDQLDGRDRSDSLEIGRLQLKLAQSERRAS